MQSVKIGTLTLTAPKVYEIYGSYAADTWHVEVPAGSYDITGKVDEFGHIDNTSVHAALPGIVVSDTAGNSFFCGVPIGEFKLNRHQGQPMVKHWSPYAHSVARALLEAQPTDEIITLEGFEPRWCMYSRDYFFGCSWDGKETGKYWLPADGTCGVTTGIYRVDEPIDRTYPNGYGNHTIRG